MLGEGDGVILAEKKKTSIFQFATSYLGLRLIQMIQGGPRGEKSGA